MRSDLTPGYLADAFAPSARRDAALRQEFEAQGTGYGGCFHQTDVDNVTQPVHGTAARSDQGMACLVVIEILGPQRADRYETVSAGVGQFDEQSGAGNAGDAALKTGSDAVGEKMRDQTIGGFALRLHGAALGDRNLGCNLAQAFGRLRVRQRPFAKSQTADQRTMHDQVGVSPDR